jgi:phosphoribosyl 1,2-cyclic phosphodiesterase
LYHLSVENYNSFFSLEMLIISRNIQLIMGTDSITFLGTGGDIIVVGKCFRTSGGFVVKTENCQLHIDPGVGALAKAIEYGINPRETTALLVSHAHTNHCNDLNLMISAMTHNGLDARGVLVANKTVLSGSGDSKIPHVVTEFHKQCLEKVMLAEPGKRMAVEDIEIIPFAVEHDELDALGFRIITPRFSLGYIPDTKYFAALADNVKKVDVLIVNVTYPGIAKENLLCSDDLIRLLKKVHPKLCVMTHFGHKMLAANLIDESRMIKQYTGIEVVAANDGTTVDPITYSAATSQESLRAFQGQEQQDSLQGSPS